MTDTANYSIDICAEQCPMTFVKVKLCLERMPVGQVLDVRLRGHEPLSNVPRSVQELGHRIVSFEKMPNQDESGIHQLLILKTR